MSGKGRNLGYLHIDASLFSFPTYIQPPPNPQLIRAWWASSPGYVADPSRPPELVTTVGSRGASPPPYALAAAPTFCIPKFTIV